jgi:hypothetical protein
MAWRIAETAHSTLHAKWPAGTSVAQQRMIDVPTTANIPPIDANQYGPANPVHENIANMSVAMATDLAVFTIGKAFVSLHMTSTLHSKSVYLDQTYFYLTTRRE